MIRFTIINVIDSDLLGCSRVDYKTAQEIAGYIKDNTEPGALDDYIVYMFRDGCRIKAMDIDEFLRMEEITNEER